MKLKIFNFAQQNINKRMNYNKPLKKSIKLPNNNMSIKAERSIEEKLVKITDLIMKRLHSIEEKNKKLLTLLKK